MDKTPFLTDIKELQRRQKDNQEKIRELEEHSDSGEAGGTRGQ